MTSFDIQPFDGALPIRFGLSRNDVRALFAAQPVSGPHVDSWGNRLEICIGYDDNDAVNHIGFSPGDFTLTYLGKPVWTPTSHTDPNEFLLEFDPLPMERVGFLVFTKVGVTTTGFHDDDPSQYALTVYPRGAWDDLLIKAKGPNLAKYFTSAQEPKTNAADGTG